MKYICLASLRMVVVLLLLLSLGVPFVPSTDRTKTTPVFSFSTLGADHANSSTPNISKYGRTRENTEECFFTCGASEIFTKKTTAPVATSHSLLPTLSARLFHLLHLHPTKVRGRGKAGEGGVFVWLDLRYLCEKIVNS